MPMMIMEVSVDMLNAQEELDLGLLLECKLLPNHQQLWCMGVSSTCQMTRPLPKALRRHRRLMSRVDTGDREPQRPLSQDGSSTPSDALLTCCVWPMSPPPAQPDMIPKPIEDDLGAVGAVQAYPYAKAVDVVEEVIKQVKPSDLAQVLPLSAFFWKDVEKIMLPPQTKVAVHEPVDLRLSRWELYEHIRHVPVMSQGIVQKTLILPWHITMDHAKMRIDERAPPHKHWLLTAASPQDWVLHQLVLPDQVHEELHELDIL